VLRFEGLRDALRAGDTIEVTNVTQGATIRARHHLSEGQVERILAGGVIRFIKRQLDDHGAEASDDEGTTLG